MNGNIVMVILFGHKYPDRKKGKNKNKDRNYKERHTTYERKRLQGCFRITYDFYFPFNVFSCLQRLAELTD
jgi:hypothetical protein